MRGAPGRRVVEVDAGVGEGAVASRPPFPAGCRGCCRDRPRAVALDLVERREHGRARHHLVDLAPHRPVRRRHRGGIKSPGRTAPRESHRGRRTSACCRFRRAGGGRSRPSACRRRRRSQPRVAPKDTRAREQVGASEELWRSRRVGGQSKTAGGCRRPSLNPEGEGPCVSARSPLTFGAISSKISAGT